MKEKIKKVLEITNIKDIIQVYDSEEDYTYNVWKIITDSNIYILKKVKEYELFIYENYLSKLELGVPKYINSYVIDNERYFLSEFVEGNTFNKCNRKDLINVLDTLIYTQKRFWNYDEVPNGYSFEDSLNNRIKRIDYLKNKSFFNYYEEYLNMYKEIPKTLCNDDLLPFNVIINDDKANIIDWEYGGILPYPTALVRLLAHSKNDENYIFYMSDEDKKFAFKYYYDNFIKDYNISYEEYMKHIFYFLIYEYSEWIYVATKNNEETELSKYYEEKINELINEASNKNKRC